jgi:hypothetical protein
MEPASGLGGGDRGMGNGWGRGWGGAEAADLKQLHTLGNLIIHRQSRRFRWAGAPQPWGSVAP